MKILDNMKLLSYKYPFLSYLSQQTELTNDFSTKMFFAILT